MGGMVQMLSQGQFAIAAHALRVEQHVGTVVRWADGGIVYPPGDDGKLIPLQPFVTIMPLLFHDPSAYVEKLRAVTALPESDELCMRHGVLQDEISAMARGPEGFDRLHQFHPERRPFLNALQKVAAARGHGDAQGYVVSMSGAIQELHGLGHFAQMAMLAEFGCAEAVRLQVPSRVPAEMSVVAAFAWQRSMQEFIEPATERFRNARGIANASNALETLQGEGAGDLPVVSLASTLFVASMQLSLKAGRYREVVEDAIRVVATMMRESVDAKSWGLVHTTFSLAAAVSEMKLADAPLAARLKDLADAALDFSKVPPPVC